MNRRIRLRARVAAFAGATALAAAAGAACAARPSAATAGALEVWVTHALEKVRPDAAAGAGRSAELSAARNEFEPFQLVLRSRRPVRDVDVEVGDLVAEGGAAGRIDRRHVAVYLQGWVDVETPSSAAGDEGEWPDPLLPRIDAYHGQRRGAFPFDLAAGRSQPLWLEVYVPPATAPGRYRGEVRITVAGAPVRTVPVILEVWPFTLPSTASLRTSFGFAGPSAVVAHLGGYTDDDDLHALTRLYFEAALRHRISLHGGSMSPPPASFGDRRAEVDWSRYDREIGPLLDGTAFRRGEPLAGARLTSIDVITISELSDEHKVLYWRAWAEHFRERGWLDRLFLYLRDEPTPEDYDEVRRLGRLARRADPELTTLLTEQLVPELTGVVDLWTPLVNCIDSACGASPCEETVDRPAYAALAAGGTGGGAAGGAGARVWWYQSCVSHGCYEVGDRSTAVWPSYVIDAAPVAGRIMPWLAWSHGIEGELYYNTVEAWGEDGADPWTDLRLHGGNGDGTLFYPGTPERIGGRSHVPVESLRLKLIREGLEDYEYLTLLSDAGAAAFARARTEAIARGPCRWQRGPQDLYAAREALGRALAARRARESGER